MELEEKLKEAKVPMIESFARILLPSIREYYKDPKHVQEANEWTKQQNKQSIDT